MNFKYKGRLVEAETKEQAIRKVCAGETTEYRAELGMFMFKVDGKDDITEKGHATADVYVNAGSPQEAERKAYRAVEKYGKDKGWDEVHVFRTIVFPSSHPPVGKRGAAAGRALGDNGVRRGGKTLAQVPQYPQVAHGRATSRSFEGPVRAGLALPVPGPWRLPFSKVFREHPGGPPSAGFPVFYNRNTKAAITKSVAYNLDYVN